MSEMVWVYWFWELWQPKRRGMSCFGTRLKISRLSWPRSKRLKRSGREFFSADEKKMIKDHVVNLLNLRIPATPNIYDLIWDHDKDTVWFFTTLKSANEELETLFLKSFKLSLIRLFPYTMADLASDLSDTQKDKLARLSPISFYKIGL